MAMVRDTLAAVRERMSAPAGLGCSRLTRNLVGRAVFK